MNNEVYFSLNDCDLSYGKKKIFEKVSLSLHDNDKIALIGKNGVGKSTIFHIITGLKDPSYGKVLINNIDCTNIPIAIFSDKGTNITTM